MVQCSTVLDNTKKEEVGGEGGKVKEEKGKRSSGMHGASSTLPSPLRVGTSSSFASTAAATTIMAPHHDESPLLDPLAEDLTFMKKTEKHK
jgi:hypothetical protein